MDSKLGDTIKGGSIENCGSPFLRPESNWWLMMVIYFNTDGDVIKDTLAQRHMNCLNFKFGLPIVW